MNNHLSECEAVWLTIRQHFLDKGMNKEKLARTLDVSARTITRWGELSAVGDQSLDSIKEKLGSLSIDWSKNQTAQAVWNFDNHNYWGALKDGPIGVRKIAGDVPCFNTSFLGRSIGAPIGVGPSIATGNSTWLSFWGNLYFDVLTYKTVRLVDKTYAPYGGPHVVVVPECSPWSVGDTEEDVNLPAEHITGTTMYPWTLANSVGIPSMPSKYWASDILIAREKLLPSQFLIVSVAGTGKSAKEFVENFVECAFLAAQSGADAIELNLSCPNIGKESADLLYQDASTTKILVEKIRTKFKSKGLDKPILLKIGFLSDEKLVDLVNKTRGLVAGYTAINAVAKNVFRFNNSGDSANAVFSRDEHNPQAGISGIAIQAHALDMVSRLNGLRNTNDEFAIIGLGGVSNSVDILNFLDTGADVVQSCTAALFDRYLAINGRNAIEKHNSIEKRVEIPENKITDMSFMKILDDINIVAKKENITLEFDEMKVIVDDYHALIAKYQKNLVDKYPNSSSRPRTTPATHHELKKIILNRHGK